VSLCVRLAGRRKTAGSEILPGSGQLSDNNKGTAGQQEYQGRLGTATSEIILIYTGNASTTVTSCPDCNACSRL
jgi:hypothetical protein